MKNLLKTLICHALQYFRGDFDGKTVEEQREIEHNKDFYIEFFKLMNKFCTPTSVRKYYKHIKFDKYKTLGWRKQIKYLPTITELRKLSLFGNKEIMTGSTALYRINL